MEKSEEEERKKKKLMGHLINPISLQVKYHGSWKLGWNQYLKKDFAYFFFLDNYIKNVLDSIIYLKSFLNKFFFYELKYFLKNDIILFYFSFKCISKTFFNFYWGYTYPFYLFANFPKFRKKHKYQEILERNFRNNASTFQLVEKYNFVKIPLVMTDTPKKMILKPVEDLFPLRSLHYAEMTCWRTANLNLEVSKNNVLSIYILKTLFLETSKLRFAVLQQVISAKSKKFTEDAFSMFLNVTRIYMDKVKSLAVPRFFRHNLLRGIFFSIIEGDDIQHDKANPELKICKLPYLIILWRSWFKRRCYIYLQRYTEYAAQKFRMTFKVKRRFINAKLRLEMKVFSKEISEFIKELRNFIYSIQIFFKQEILERKDGSVYRYSTPHSTFFFRKEEVDLFKKDFFIVIDHNTRNYILIKWLTEFYIKVAMQF